MINFYINGDETSVQLENEKTIGDVLHSFELTFVEIAPIPHEQQIYSSRI